MPALLFVEKYSKVIFTIKKKAVPLRGKNQINIKYVLEKFFEGALRGASGKDEGEREKMCFVCEPD